MTVIRRVLRRPLRSVAFDVFVVGLVLLFGLVAMASQPGWKASLVGVGMAVALLFRRAHPVTVAGVVGALGLVQLIGAWGPLPYDIAVLVALYSVVKYADRLRDGVLAGIGALAGAVPAALQIENGGRWWVSAIVLGLVTGAVWLVGLNVRTRRLYVLSLEERAATLEREREAEARAAVAGERTRIARELHDVVAHGMAVMIVQADGARFMIDRDPEAARQAVKVVADTGRQALEEMRRLVGVLREPSAPEATTGPGPDDAAVGGDPERRRLVLAELPALLDRFRDAGLRVRQTVTGEPATLPPGLELTVYRVAQEALTNALKHAGVGAEVELTLEYGPDDVVVRVVDDGQGRPAANPTPSGGHGLIGMRERVGVYDGSLAAGARLAGGWQLEVRLPLPSSAATTEVIAA
ncbi:sensor histidine kinase [Micromonospora avicenniae]|uniref:histidine kinase n=1 Tax=Micromonospora avicenniae TaxID=1198245 RepID=A0A1N7D4N8_9ACTN|nr:histidine kinase [Micromonospora avicenniae]SIR70762.1 Signal transduction histidine kinase [Micromonospora avicenniae]